MPACRSTGWPQSLWARVQRAAGHPCGDSRGRLPRRIPARERARRCSRAKGRRSPTCRRSEGDRAGAARSRSASSGRSRTATSRTSASASTSCRSEQAIYDSRPGRARARRCCATRGLTFEADGALWLRTTEFGDDKDRVLRKSDGSFTYLVPDIAYHIDKHDRGFDRVIDVWGADHHGYIPRMRAVLAALGYPPEFFDVALVQLVKVVRGGEEVKMSKRSGEFVTLRDLLRGGRRGRGALLLPHAQGREPARLRRRPRQAADRREPGLLRPDGARAPERHLPHRRAGARERRRARSTSPRSRRRRTPSCSRSWRRFPRSWTRPRASASRTASPSILHELATAVHGWYHHTRAVGAPEGPATEQARLLLARAARIVLANAPRPAGHHRPGPDVT